MKKRLKKIILTVSVIFTVLILISLLSEKDNYYPPKTEMRDLKKIVSDGIDETEYETIKEQTGLSKTAIDEIMKKQNYLSELLEFQTQNFDKYKISCDYMIFPFTKCETLYDKRGKSVRLKLPDIKRGDIFVTLSTHTFLFRHGHTGLVTDEYTHEVLEAFMLGENSDYGNSTIWKKFPTAAVLRPRNLSEEEIDKVVTYAKEKLWNVKYDLTAGVLGKDKDENGNFLKTHCSHLVWAAYKSIGVDIDGNGGIFVLPEDFLKSENLEIIWSYGINVSK